MPKKETKKIAVFSPGPSYHNPEVRKVAGWINILEMYKDALEELGFEVVIPEISPDLIDESSTVSKILSYDTWAAVNYEKELKEAEIFLGPPGYSINQLRTFKSGKTPKGVKRRAFVYVWNNADWYRDQQLAEEFQNCKRHYDLSPSWREINRAGLELADHVIACSPWVKQTHSSIVPPEKIHITRWGVDSEMFFPKENPIKDDPLKVIFVGGDPVRKGLGYLLRAAINADREMVVHIVGCEVLSKEVAQEGKVTFVQIGAVPHEVMPRVMQQAHVICIPTLEDGIACSLQEGMACGLVPITTPECAEVYDFRKTEADMDDMVGYMVEYRDVEGLATTLQVLADDIEQRKRVAEGALKCARGFSWEDTKEEFKQVIRGDDPSST